MNVRSLKSPAIIVLFVLALVLSAVSGKATFADGVFFFLTSLLDPWPVNLDPRFAAIYLRNLFSGMYTLAGGVDFRVARVLFSLGASIHIFWCGAVLYCRGLRNERGSAMLILMALVAGVFFLSNFPASELITFHCLTCLLLHNYISMPAKQLPIWHAPLIVVASFSYEISVVSNAMFAAYILLNREKGKFRVTDMFLHVICMLVTVGMVWLKGVNKNSSSVFSMDTLVVTALVAALFAISVWLQDRFWIVLVACVSVVILAIGHLLPYPAMFLLGHLFRDFSYTGRGVTILFGLGIYAVILFLPSWVRALLVVRDGVFNFVLIFLTYQIVSCFVWSKYWTDFREGVAKEPATVALQDCAVCQKSYHVSKRGVSLGWAWTWGLAGLAASIENHSPGGGNIVLPDGQVYLTADQERLLRLKYDGR